MSDNLHVVYTHYYPNGGDNDTYDVPYLAKKINILKSNIVNANNHNIFKKNTNSNKGFILFLVSFIGTILCLFLTLHYRYTETNIIKLLLILFNVIFLLISASSIVLNGLSFIIPEIKREYYLKDPAKINSDPADVYENIYIPLRDNRNIAFFVVSFITLLLSPILISLLLIL